MLAVYNLHSLVSNSPACLDVERIRLALLDQLAVTPSRARDRFTPGAIADY